MTLRFEIIEGGEVVETRELDRDVVKIGKLGSSHLKLEDPSVSRIHAVLEEGSDGTYSVIDLGSAEGTWINGEQVTKGQVADGDELRFGDVTVAVHFVADQPDTTEPVNAQASTGAQTTSDDPHARADQQEAQPAAGAGLEADTEADWDAQDHTAAQGQTSGAQQDPYQNQSDTPQGDGYQADAQQQAYTITTDDGRQVEPYTLEGYYDEGGNYIPGYYDENGQYHLGYGYYDDQGEWQVAYGYYDDQGEWIATDEPVSSAVGLGAASRRADRPSDRDEYTDAFFNDRGGDTLEVAHLWGDHVVRVESFGKPRTVTYGPSRDEDFIVGQDLAPEQHPLVRYQEGQYQLVITPEMTGFVQNDGQEYTIDEVMQKGLAQQSPEVGGYVLPLGSQTSARVELQGNVFLLHFTSMPVGVGASLGFDTEPAPYFGISAAAHILFLLLAMSLPGDAGDLSLDRFSQQDRFVQMMLKPEKKEKKKDDFFDKGKKEKAAKHKGKESKAGKKNSEQKDKEMAMKGPPDNEETKIRKARDRKIAMNAGLNKMFQSDSVSSMFGSSSKTVGSDAIHAMGNMDGSSKGESQGFGGLGLQGAGRGGGGGMSERGLGIGRVGTAGRGGGGRGGKKYGEGAADMGEKKKARPQVVPQRPDVSGALDKDIIRKVVRQHRREIKFCYEQELQKNPELGGRVTVKFTISPTGDVIGASVTKSTLNNTKVESCMQRKIQRWVFPAPKGGGIVQVNYPFNFATSN